MLLFLTPLLCQGTANFGGIRVGNGPTEDEAEIIQHDQLSQHSEEEPEVRDTSLSNTVFHLTKAGKNGSLVRYGGGGGGGGIRPTHITQGIRPTHIFE